MDKNLHTFIYQLVDLCLQTPTWALLQEDQKEILAHNLEDHFFQVATEALVKKISDEQFFILENQNSQDGSCETVIIELSDGSTQVIQDIEESLKKEWTNIIQSIKPAQ